MSLGWFEGGFWFCWGLLFGCVCVTVSLFCFGVGVLRVLGWVGLVVIVLVVWVVDLFGYVLGLVVSIVTHLIVITVLGWGCWLLYCLVCV